MSNLLICENCKRMLVLGTIRDETEEWCPYCKGFSILSKIEAEKYLEEQFNKKMTAIKNCWSKYSKDSLIGSLVTFREGELHFQKQINSHNFDLFISISYIIKEIVNDNNTTFGSKTIKVTEEDFQKIIRYAERLLLDLKFIQHIKNDVCVLIKIPKEHLREYTIDYDKNIKYNLVDKDSASEIQIKFTKKWKHTKENFEKFGLYSLINSIESKGEDSGFISEIKKSIGLKIAFDMVCPDNSFVDFPDFKKKREYIEFLESLTHTAMENVDFECDISKKTFMCNLRPYDMIEFMLLNFKQDEKLKELFKLIVFDQTKCEKFPIVFLSHLRQGLYIPPYTCYLIHLYLNAKYIIDEEVENAKEGELFEPEIATKLNSIGISTRIPNQSSGMLMNIKDDPIEPSLEIDIIGHTKDTIWIIDCKHFFLERTFLTGDRGKKMQRRLKGLKIEEKQQRRIQYVKDNLDKWGFSKKKIKHFKSAVVTLLKEPLNNIGNTHLISENELKRLYLIPDYEINSNEE